MSKLDWAEPTRQAHAAWLARYRQLLEIRRREIVPRLHGMEEFAGRYRALGARSVIVEWRLGDGSQLCLIANFAAEPVSAADIPDMGRMLYASAETARHPTERDLRVAIPMT
jgi:maltooligosyltrehalose trehalohydrolase